MQFILTLSLENIELSRYEAINLLDLKNYEIKDNIILCDLCSDLYKRLAYTKTVHKVMFQCKKEVILEMIKKFDFKDINGKEFSVKLVGSSEFHTKDIATAVHSTVKEPRINLKNPSFAIEFIFIRDYVYCCERIYKNNDNFEIRKAHKRPELHPSSMHPKLARACINLTGIKKGKIIDPFCGSGGILIEAGMMGLFPIGYDIDEIMLKRVVKNLEHYNIDNYLLEQKDATKLTEKIDFVVCDPPYGKNTKQKGTEKLYGEFIVNLDKILQKKAVIVYPDWIEAKKFFNNTTLKITSEFSIRVHKSLTRNIIVIERS